MAPAAAIAAAAALLPAPAEGRHVGRHRDRRLTNRNEGVRQVVEGGRARRGQRPRPFRIVFVERRVERLHDQPAGIALWDAAVRDGREEPLWIVLVPFVPQSLEV